MYLCNNLLYTDSDSYIVGEPIATDTKIGIALFPIAI